VIHFLNKETIFFGESVCLSFVATAHFRRASLLVSVVEIQLKKKPVPPHPKKSMNE